ncbi:hypothetical protein BDR07DRAFT_525691 [Suillus spraguei]|nr:hypothetical protein BDR07DRAFT_525691 [Suillus spraguei]
MLTDLKCKFYILCRPLTLRISAASKSHLISSRSQAPASTTFSPENAYSIVDAGVWHAFRIGGGGTDGGVSWEGNETTYCILGFRVQTKNTEDDRICLDLLGCTICGRKFNSMITIFTMPDSSCEYLPVSPPYLAR